MPSPTGYRPDGLQRVLKTAENVNRAREERRGEPTEPAHGRATYAHGNGKFGASRPLPKAIANRALTLGDTRAHIGLITGVLRP